MSAKHPEADVNSFRTDEIKQSLLSRKGVNMNWDELKNQGSEHYKTGGVEPVDLYKAGGMFRFFALCSIIKYAFRSRDLTDTELFLKNMDKIIDYAQKLKASEEKPKTLFKKHTRKKEPVTATDIEKFNALFKPTGLQLDDRS